MRGPMRTLVIASCDAHLGSSLAFVTAFAAVLPGVAEIQLLPAGEFATIDGRPEKGKKWRLDRAAAERLIAFHAERANDLVIDYEHQSLRAPDNGQPAPAAGWYKRLEWREGKGLFATDVRWTDRAKEMIAAGEYRFVSPVILYDKKTLVPLALGPAALVNVPAIDGMQEVALSALANQYASRSHHLETTSMEKHPPLVAILAALGIDINTKPEDATTAIATLKAKAAKADELEPKVAKLSDLEAQVAALKAKNPGDVDPTKFVSIEQFKELQTKLSELSGASVDQQVDTLVTAAMKDGKILPGSEKWARDLGKKDFAALKSFIDTATPIASLAGTQTNGKQSAAFAAGLTDTQAKLCSAMGVKPEDYKKTLEVAAAQAA